MTDHINFISIMLKISGTRCNINCQYCYEHNDDKIFNKNIELIDLKEFLLSYTKYDHIFIMLHGGEPLLSPKKDIEELLSFIFNLFGDKVKVQIQTNGTLLNDKMVRLFAQYGQQLSMSISFDPKGKKDLRFDNPRIRDVVKNNIENAVAKIGNVGIVSVAHSYNIDCFVDFISELRKIKVQNLTINKVHTHFGAPFFISESNYVKLLKEIFNVWIKETWYKDLKIQPLVSLFSKKANKLCIYLANPNKCRCFHTFYNKQAVFYHCDHITTKIPQLPIECKKCLIYEKCGGGCLIEKKDPTFCSARKELFNFIEEKINENKTINSQ